MNIFRVKINIDFQLILMLYIAKYQNVLYCLNYLYYVNDYANDIVNILSWYSLQIYTAPPI